MPENSSDDRACTTGHGFACIDPEAPCSEDDDITPDMVASCEDVRESRQLLPALYHYMCLNVRDVSYIFLDPNQGVHEIILWHLRGSA